MTETEPIHRAHIFAFTVRYGADEETIHIVDLDYLAEEYPV